MISPGGNESEQSEILRRNIRAVVEMQRKTDSAESRQERMADRMTRFSGSMLFVYLHTIWFGIWILLNVGLFDLPPFTGFDPYPFGLLTLVVSLEAIFLSTFVLISQNRDARISARRNELDLQVNLLAEQKTAKVIEMLDHVIEQLNAMNNSFYVPRDREVAALKVSPPPEEVMRVIDDSVEEETREVKEEIGKSTEAITEKVDSSRKGVEHVGEEVEKVAADVRQIVERKDQRRK
ncbi:MAG TPA: DUF1003 domain-containing protein [Blastocatellia bacterium]|nr:DUF1003 domain-containing protein [Blastocatellia bacterium]